MKVTFLGTGTGEPHPDRGSPGLLVETHDLRILVDGGSGTLRQLARIGVAWYDLNHFLLTHFHPDHTADLVPFLFAMRYGPEAERDQPIMVCGPAGLMTLIGHLTGAYGYWIDAKGRVAFREFPAGTANRLHFGDLLVETGPVMHTDHSLGYRFTDERGKVLVVTGDAGYGDGLIELAANADLLITECTYPPGKQAGKHLNPELAGRAAREAGAKALALTHFRPETAGHNLLEAVRREFSGPVTLAEDFEALTI